MIPCPIASPSRTVIGELLALERALPAAMLLIIEAEIQAGPTRVAVDAKGSTI